MLKKLMSLAVIGMLMVGCTDTKESVKHEVPDTSNSTRQEQQVQPKKEEVKKQQPKQQIKEQPKEQIKKDTTKKEQNDNIDPETGLAKVKDGTHLQEEADKQEEDYGIWTKDYCPECGQPIDDCICDGDGYTNSNLNDVQEYQCSNCGDYYTEGAEHTCTSQYTDYEGNTVVETWKNGQMVDTTTIYNNDAEPDEFKDTEDTEEY